MKVLSLPAFVLCSLASVSVATPVQERQAPNAVFVPVPIPENFVPNAALLARAFGTVSAPPATPYTADTWAAHVLEQCSKIPATTAVASYSDPAKGFYWIGMCIGKGPVTTKDFEVTTTPAVLGARAFTQVPVPKP